MKVKDFVKRLKKLNQNAELNFYLPLELEQDIFYNHNCNYKITEVGLGSDDKDHCYITCKIEYSEVEYIEEGVDED